jgi:hypothetical protein
MKFASVVFYVAGIYGLLNLLPQYFLEERVGVDYPPPVTHPEYFYGMLGVAIAWQLAFLLIGRDPVGLRVMMLPAMFEKFSFAAACAVLYGQGRLPGVVLGFGMIDLVLGVLFVAAFRATRPQTML